MFTARLRFATWAFCVITQIAGTLSWLWLLRGARILDSDSTLVGGWIALSSNLLVMFALLRTTPVGAIRLPHRASVTLVLGGAVALHAAAFVLLLPALSEDVVRYRADGRTWLAGLSPYVVSPSQLPNPDAIDRLAVYPELHSIYPPAAQAFFALCAAREPVIEALPNPHDPNWRGQLHALTFRQRAMGLRLGAAIASLVCTALLLHLTSARGISPWAAALFGWHPLVVVETAGMAHVDVVGVLFVLLMLLLATHGKDRLAGAALALATAVKPPALLLLPLLLLRTRSGRRACAALAFAITGTLVFVPVLAWQHGYRGWIDTARQFSARWEANGSIYELIKHVLGGGDHDSGVAFENAKQIGRRIATAAPLILLAILAQARAGVARGGYWMFLVGALVSPVVYPWYLLWMLCFVPLLHGAQGIAGMVFAATVSLSYLLWRTSDWVLPGNVLVLEYVAVYVALVGELVAGMITSLRGPAPARFSGETSAP